MDLSDMDTNDGRQHLLRKLHRVFKDGYRPARGNERYPEPINALDVFASLDKPQPKKHYLIDRVNCLGHVFNLRNQQFQDYQIKPYKLYGNFDEHLPKQPAALAQDLLDFIKETGLQVTECDPNELITDFKSWKIALYFAPSDFHFLLEEAPHQWSSKLGFGGHVAWETELPLKFNNRACNPEIYDFFNTYKLTNPRADGNNRYIKPTSREF